MSVTAMARCAALIALVVAAGRANQPAPPQQGARVVDRSGVVWDAVWDQAGRQYYVDRATGRTSWQIDSAAAGSPGYYKARARARVVELLGDQLFSLPAPPSAPALVATVTPPGDEPEERVTQA